MATGILKELDAERASTPRWYGGCETPPLNNNVLFETIHKTNKIAGGPK